MPKLKIQRKVRKQILGKKYAEKEPDKCSGGDLEFLSLYSLHT